MKKVKAKVECVYVNPNREAFGFDQGQEVNPSHPVEIKNLPQFEEVIEPVKEYKETKKKKRDKEDIA